MADHLDPIGAPGATSPSVGATGLADEHLAPAPAPAKPSRKAARTAIAGVLAVGALGFAAVNLAAGDGAASPEKAVEAFFGAMDQEDAIGVVEALEPTERRILMAALRETDREASRLEVTSTEVDLRQVPGIELEVTGLQLRADPLAEGVVAIELVAGTVSTASDLADMPLGPVITEAISRSEDSGEVVDERASGEVDLAGGRLVAVQRGGGWHVSLLYTLAEQARLESDPVRLFPAAGTAIPAKGAASPEAAVREGISAAAELDVERLIELTPADEARVLHEYGPLLVAAVNDAVDDDAVDDDQEVEISDVSLSVSDAPDGRKVVSANTITISHGDAEGTTTMSYADGCTTSAYAFDDDYVASATQDYPDDAEYYEDSEWTICDTDEASLISPFALLGLFWSPGSADVVVEEHDGAWFLSPTQTIVKNSIGLLRDFDVDQVRRAVRTWTGEWWIIQPDEFWEACRVDAPTLETSRADGEQAYEACIEDLPDDYSPAFGGLAGRSERFRDVGTYASFPADDCYSDAAYESDDPNVEILACLEGLVADGVVDQSVVDEFRCQQIFDDIDFSRPEEELDAAYEAAQQEYEACVSGLGDAEPGG